LWIEILDSQEYSALFSLPAEGHRIYFLKRDERLSAATLFI
jgi:hypothetical protein